MERLESMDAELFVLGSQNHWCLELLLKRISDLEWALESHSGICVEDCSHDDCRLVKRILSGEAQRPDYEPMHASSMPVLAELLRSEQSPLKRSLNAV